MKDPVSLFLHDERGGELVEYALLALLIALISIAAITSLGGSMAGKSNGVAGALPQPPGPGRVGGPAGSPGPAAR